MSHPSVVQLFCLSVTLLLEVCLCGWYRFPKDMILTTNLVNIHIILNPVNNTYFLAYFNPLNLLRYPCLIIIRPTFAR